MRELKDVFITGNIQRKDPANRILLGTTTEAFQQQFAEVRANPGFVTDAVWRGRWRPGDRIETNYKFVDWGTPTPVNELELLAGQHRRQALEDTILENGQSKDEHFWWICNVYDLTTIPAPIGMEITANIISPKKAQSTAEIFRDMWALAPHLAVTDTDIVRPRLNRAPTVKEYLEASHKGDKKKVETTFANILSICAAVTNSPDKYRIVLASPMSEEIAHFCNTNVGMEMFTLNMVYEMTMLACFEVAFSSFLTDSI